MMPVDQSAEAWVISRSAAQASSSWSASWATMLRSRSRDRPSQARPGRPGRLRPAQPAL